MHSVITIFIYYSKATSTCSFLASTKATQLRIILLKIIRYVESGQFLDDHLFKGEEWHYSQQLTLDTVDPQVGGGVTL